MKILNFGSVNIDLNFKVDHIVRPGETISSTNFTKSPGGKGLNQSIALSKVNENVYHAGKYGQDGEFIKKILEDNGVSTNFLEKSEKNTGNALIQIDKNGENSIVLYKGANYDIDKNFVDKVLENFSKGDCIVLQNEISSLKYIIDKAYHKKMKICLNPSPINEIIFDLDLNKLNFLILNETEAKDISKFSDKDEIIKFFRKTYPNLKIILTLGSKGSIYFDKNQIIKQKPYLVKARDTTGAGDTFMGYFVGLYFDGNSIENSLNLASKASALACTKNGSQESIPNLKDLENFKIDN